MPDKLVSINPATLEENGSFETATEQDVKNAVLEAREAQKEWAALSVDRRGKILIKLKEHILDSVDRIADVITRDNGKTLLEAVNAEVYPVLDMLTFCGREAEGHLQPEHLKNPIFAAARIESRNIFQPMGVVGIISPWNFPFAIPMTQIAAALITGNGVVLKPAEITPMVGNLIEQIINESKIPKGLVKVAQGEGAVVGDALVSAKPDRLIFTGSVRVGKLLMKRAADELIPITLELGGKDPFIVLEDADIERASSAAVWGAFINAGQVCASVERVYVHERVADRFIEKVIAKAGKLRVGNGLFHDVDMGPLTSERQRDLAESHVADAREKGATIATGGKRPEGLNGWFYEPTVITGADHGMLCMTEETFGPTLPIMIVADAEEALRFANDSRYGLTASVWTANVERGEKLCEKIKGGVTVVNDCLLTYGFAQCPWGGVGDSGFGRTHSVHGLHELTSVKNITVARSILRDDLWWHPYSERKYKGMKAMLKTVFCEGVACKAEGIIEILRSLKK